MSKESETRRDWLTYRQAQDLTSISRTRLWTLISSGEVQAARVGRAVRINRRSLEDYLLRNPYLSEREVAE